MEIRISNFELIENWINNVEKRKKLMVKLIEKVSATIKDGEDGIGISSYDIYEVAKAFRIISNEIIKAKQENK